MPRALRLQEAGFVHHVTNRGNDGQVIFRESSDYKQFLTLVEESRQLFPVFLYNYMIMDNHFHLLLEPKEEGALSKFMEYVSKGYAKYFNKKYERQGHVFIGRFKSFTIQSEKYFFTSSCYIDSNPVKANIVNKPEDYAWSGYRALGKGQKGQVALDLHDIYLSLGNSDMERQIAYRAFVGNYQGVIIDFYKRRAGTLGDPEFKRQIKSRAKI